MHAAATIRVERDPAFWRGILSHPEVRHVMRGLDPGAALDAVILNDTVLPIASDHGGYLFVQMDPFGRIFDLHAAYTPEGRGREALGALKAALEMVDADLVVAFETDDQSSRPPLSMGFKPTGEARETPLGPIRTWVLTRADWEASAAWARMH